MLSKIEFNHDLDCPKKRLIRNGLLIVGGIVVLSLMVEPALAQTSGGTDGFQALNNGATQIKTLLTGSFAKTCAVIAVASSGLMAMAGRIPWSWAISIIVGIALVFGAQQVVDMFSNGSGS